MRVADKPLREAVIKLIKRKWIASAIFEREMERPYDPTTNGRAYLALTRRAEDDFCYD